MSPSHRDKCLFGRVHGTNLSHLMTSANTRRLNGAGSLEPKEECRAIAKRRREGAYIRARIAFLSVGSRISHTETIRMYLVRDERVYGKQKSKQLTCLCISTFRPYDIS